MKVFTLILAVCITAVVLARASVALSNAAPAPNETHTATTVAAGPSVERGRYLIRTTGCNDCHTPGYAESGGKLPESEWLMGMPVGFKGAWGVSYPANLRLTVQAMTEDEWLQFARSERRPPMPWFALRDMSDDDVRSLYRFMRTLEPKGERTPPAVAPGDVVSTPVIVFEPQMPEAQLRVSQR